METRLTYFPHAFQHITEETETYATFDEQYEAVCIKGIGPVSHLHLRAACIMVRFVERKQLIQTLSEDFHKLDPYEVLYKRKKIEWIEQQLIMEGILNTEKELQYIRYDWLREQLT